MSEDAGFIEQKRQKQLAIKIKTDIENGTITFKDAAAKYSEDLLNKNNGGLLGWFSLSELKKNLSFTEDAINNLNAKKITEPIFIVRGFILYSCDVILRSGNIPYKKASAMVKDKIVLNQRMKVLNQQVDVMFKEAVLEKKIKDRFYNLQLPHHRFK